MDRSTRTTDPAPVIVLALLALLLILIASPCHAAVAYVQYAEGTSAPDTSVTATWSGATVANNLVVGVVTWDDAGVSITSTPTSWVEAARITDITSDTGLAVYYRQNCPSISGGMTFGFDGSVNATVTIAEFSGIKTSGAFDQKNTYSNSGSTACYTGAVVTTEQNELLISGGVTDVASNFDWSAESFIELSDLDAGASHSGSASYRIVATSGTYEGSAGVTLSNNAGAIATFEATVAAATAQSLMPGMD
jgi:hypothetical protein